MASAYCRPSAEGHLGGLRIHDPRRQDRQVPVAGHADATRSRHRGPRARRACRRACRSRSARRRCRSDPAGGRHRGRSPGRPCEAASSRACCAQLPRALQVGGEEPTLRFSDQQAHARSRSRSGVAGWSAISARRLVHVCPQLLGRLAVTECDREQVEQLRCRVERPAGLQVQLAWRESRPSSASSFCSIGAGRIGELARTARPARRPAGRPACSRSPAGRARTPPAAPRSGSPRRPPSATPGTPATAARPARSGARRGRRSTPRGSSRTRRPGHGSAAAVTAGPSRRSRPAGAGGGSRSSRGRCTGTDR